MKRFTIVLLGLIAVAALALAGCTGDFSEPNPGVDAHDSCVTCHSDKEMLIATAAVPEAAEAEASGEG